MKRYDILVVGSGVAGLSYAIHMNELLPSSSIAIVTKTNVNEGNTRYAQGGIAVVIDQISDSYQQHITDTLKAGDGLCNEEIVELVIKEGPIRFNELVKWGIEFDKDHQGNYSLGLEGGHSKNRILHHKDRTGQAIEKTLLNRIQAIDQIDVYTHHIAIDLVTSLQHSQTQIQHTSCRGALVLNQNTNEVIHFDAKVTLLATGGIGQVYNNTTNPAVATGDGIAMADRANAQIRGMEFIQFHPTALYQPNERPYFLISEAVRGFGALLRSKSGGLFMHKYSSEKELAPRDVVSRAIYNELKSSKEDFVYLDCRHLNQVQFKQHFPNITAKLKALNIHLDKDMIPVIPAVHYLCGGIDVNKYGETSIKNLFACGECANSGLHGANRLASNSLLEALVFSYSCALKSAEKCKASGNKPDVSLNCDHMKSNNSTNHLDLSSFRTEVQRIMSDQVGIIRTNKELLEAQTKINLLKQKTDDLYESNNLSGQLIELRNLITIAQLIISQSLNRVQNKGVFYKV